MSLYKTDLYNRVRFLAENPEVGVQHYDAAEAAELLAEIRDLQRLADARIDLLREHYGYHLGLPGKVTPCENPQQYGEDCGECMRCMSISSEGAFKLPTSPRGTQTKCERIGMHVHGGCDLHS